MLFGVGEFFIFVIFGCAFSFLMVQVRKGCGRSDLEWYHVHGNCDFLTMKVLVNVKYNEDDQDQGP